MQKSRIIFFGSPEFAIPVLKALIASDLSPVAVITEPDRPAGRGKKIVASAIKIVANKYNIPVLQPEKIVNLKSKILNLQPDLAVVVAYGQIIPKEILDIPKFGFINIHPSILPKYRGPSPIQAAILNGDKETGVTIIKLDPKLDHGPILASSKFKILNPKQIQNSNVQNPKQDYQTLSKKLAYLGAELLIKTLPDYLNGKIELKEQDHSNATYTKLINKSDGQISWGEPIEIIERKTRAYNPWPSTFFFVNNKRLKICQAHIEYGKLIIDKVKPESKKEMLWQEFIKGNKEIQEFVDNKLLI